MREVNIDLLFIKYWVWIITNDKPREVLIYLLIRLYKKYLITLYCLFVKIIYQYIQIFLFIFCKIAGVLCFTLIHRMLD